MNSEELSRLSDYKNSRLTYTDAYDIITKKILINKLSIENLNKHITYASNIKRVQDILINIAVSKQELIKQLNKALETQLKEFTDVAQDECNYLYGCINELDEPNMEYIRLNKSIKDLENEIRELNNKIQVIENTIPDTKLITNYSIKIKQDNCNDLEAANIEYNE